MVGKFYGDVGKEFLFNFDQIRQEELVECCKEQIISENYVEVGKLLPNKDYKNVDGMVVIYAKLPSSCFDDLLHKERLIIQKVNSNVNRVNVSGSIKNSGSQLCLPTKLGGEQVFSVTVEEDIVPYIEIVHYKKKSV